jgi:dihydropteroate synthase
MTTRYLQCGRYKLAVGQDDRPLVMGVLNITPDSFSDGGKFQHLDLALTHVEQKPARSGAVAA